MAEGEGRERWFLRAIVGGHFRLDRCIGQGGMGVVWAATNTRTRRRVAIKLLKGDRASDPRVRRRFLREARAASAVRHPNVVEILDVLELDDGSPAMVMELLEGESLGQRLRARKSLGVDETASLLLPVVSAVGTAHALGIVHRDLKPDNIFLARTPDRQVTVKVVDFGIAKMHAVEGEPAVTEGLTGTGTLLGTPHYMSPEQVFAEESIDYRSDIWAFGIILYECLTGVRPTKAENLGQVMKIIATRGIVPLEKAKPDLPRDITEIVGRMLANDKAERPQSLDELREVLAKYSTVAVWTFGDPVLAPVRGADASSSGSHGALLRKDIELIGAGPSTGITERQESPTRTAPGDPTSAPASSEDATSISGAAEGDGSAPGSPEVALGGPGGIPPGNETQDSVGFTLQEALTVRRRRGIYALAALGATTLVGLGVMLARPSAPGAPAAAIPSSTGVPPTAASPPKPADLAASAEPFRPVDSDASERAAIVPSAAAPAPPTPKVVAAPPRPRELAPGATSPARPPPSAAGAAAAPAPSKAPSAPGRLVEAPPF